MISEKTIKDSLIIILPVIFTVIITILKDYHWGYQVISLAILISITLFTSWICDRTRRVNKIEVRLYQVEKHLEILAEKLNWEAENGKLFKFQK